MSPTEVPSARQSQEQQKQAQLNKGRRGLGTDLLDYQYPNHETVDLLAKKVQDLDRNNKIYSSYQVQQEEQDLNAVNDSQNQFSFFDKEAPVQDATKFNRSVNASNFVSSDALVTQQNKKMRVFRQTDIVPQPKN